jgi:C4-dicarboxylate-specific signal transduction histidine kinase
MSMGELTASIAHEVNQPLTAVITYGNACLRWLARAEPDLIEIGNAVHRIIKDANRASDVIQRIRDFLRRGEQGKIDLRIEDVIGDVVNLSQGEARARDVSLHVHTAANLSGVTGDRVQLQQVVLNLALNGIEAMSSVYERPRVLDLSAETGEKDSLLIVVRDSGTGFGTAHRDRLFDAFYTTKSEGMGMGLAISRSIVESHGGRLWAAPNTPFGATFQFVLPAAGVRV